MPRLATLASVALLTAVCGCSNLSGGLESLNLFGPRYVVADAKNPVVELACIWQPGEGRNSKGVPARGFSGQVFFFTRRDAEPALVDGGMRIYLFADRGTPEERGKPLCELDVSPEAWATHATMTSLGPGYSIFVPYPESEAYQVRCELRVRFTPRHGEPVWSEAVTMTLEGPPRPGQEPNSWATAEAQALVSAETRMSVTQRRGTPAQLGGSESATDETSRTLRIDTIPLGELQQIAYEAPVHRDAIPRPATKPAIFEPNPLRLEQALAGISLDESNHSSHPLRGKDRPQRRSAHPLESMATPALMPVASRPQPLDKVAPLAETAPEMTSRSRPSYPNLSSPRLRAGEVRRGSREMEESFTAVRLSLDDTQPAAAPASPVRFAGRQLRERPERPAYGVWQPLGE